MPLYGYDPAPSERPRRDPTDRDKPEETWTATVQPATADSPEMYTMTRAPAAPNTFQVTPTAKTYWVVLNDRGEQVDKTYDATEAYQLSLSGRVNFNDVRLDVGNATNVQQTGVIPYDNSGALLPQYAGQYPGQVGVPDPAHVPVYAVGPSGTQGTFTGYAEAPAQMVAPTTEQALKYGAEMARLQEAIDTLKENLAKGTGDITAQTRKLISYSQRLAALANKAQGTPNPSLTPPATPAPAAATPAAPAATSSTSLLLPPDAQNPPPAAPDYAAATEANLRYAQNMQAAAKKAKDEKRRQELMKRAMQYSTRAQTYGAKITQKPSGGTPNA